MLCALRSMETRLVMGSNDEGGRFGSFESNQQSKLNISLNLRENMELNKM